MLARSWPRSCRRVSWRGRWRRLSIKAQPREVEEIDCVPRVATWSLKELHDADAVTVGTVDSVLDQDKLRELASLCHLHIDEKRMPGLLKDVEAILQCARNVQAVTTTENIDKMYAEHLQSLDPAPLREDIVTEGGLVDDILANAAKRSGSFFTVPKVLQE